MDAAETFWWVAAVAGGFVIVMIALAVASIMALSVVDQWKRKAIERRAYAAELSSTSILKGGGR